MKNLFDFNKVAKFFYLGKVKIVLWLIFFIIFSPFLLMRISEILGIQITGELPQFFDNSFFFHLFSISWFLYLPILFLDEKLFTIFGDSLFSIGKLKAGFDIFMFFVSTLYAYLLSCLLEPLVVFTIRLGKKIF